MTGWKLVPVEATAKMISEAGGECVNLYYADDPSYCPKDVWGEMQGAAPTPPDEVLERMTRAFIEAWQPKLGLMDEEMGEAVSAMRAALAAAEAT